MRGCLIVLFALMIFSPARAALPPVAPAPTLPGLDAARMQTLLQTFVDTEYLKAFRHLGDERDFDHGHILFDARTHKAAAILYHTQELAFYQKPGSAFGFVNPGARNWLQWIDDPARIENASGYVRKDFPDTGSWEWFTKMELPALRLHHTILDKMLDGKRLGLDTSHSEQWVFTREACPARARPSTLSVTLPNHQRVCLALSQT